MLNIEVDGVNMRVPVDFLIPSTNNIAGSPERAWAGFLNIGIEWPSLKPAGKRADRMAFELDRSSKAMQGHVIRLTNIRWLPFQSGRSPRGLYKRYKSGQIYHYGEHELGEVRLGDFLVIRNNEKRQANDFYLGTYLPQENIHTFIKLWPNFGAGLRGSKVNDFYAFHSDMEFDDKDLRYTMFTTGKIMSEFSNEIKEINDIIGGWVVK